MRWIKLNGLVILLVALVVPEALAGLNVLSAVSNYTTRPLEEILVGKKDFIQMAAENGYNAEKHELVTDDGYILTMFRIPPGKTCAKKTPILLMHGLMLTADCFIIAGPEAPGFVLAEDCYDLWFGNLRGNIYSRSHVTLNPDKDLQFWKFSANEMGLYDIPAMVDYVLDATNMKKLIFLAWSQGGGIFFMMNSEKPEYADKISLFIGLAPTSRLYYTRSVAFRTLFPLVNSLEPTLEAAGIWEVLSYGFPVQAILGILCQVNLLAAVVCGSVETLLDWPHPGSITPEVEKRLFQSFLAGTSVQNIAYNGQALTNKKFVKFDYGSEHNLKVYGSTEPPEYDLGASTTPAVVFTGKEDHLVDIRDLEWAVGQLPNVLDLITVDDPLWNHIDMVYSPYWKDVVFVKMKKYLDKYNDINDSNYRTSD